MALILYNTDIISVLTISGYAHQAELVWLSQNVQPEYTDNTNKENLYSVDFPEYLEEEQIVVPDYIKEFLSEIKKYNDDIAYFRFAF